MVGPLSILACRPEVSYAKPEVGIAEAVEVRSRMVKKMARHQSERDFDVMAISGVRGNVWCLWCLTLEGDADVVEVGGSSGCSFEVVGLWAWK